MSALSWFMLFLPHCNVRSFAWKAVKKFSFSTSFQWKAFIFKWFYIDDLKWKSERKKERTKWWTKRSPWIWKEQSDQCDIGHPCTWIMDTQSAPLPQIVTLKKPSAPPRLNNKDGGRLNSSDTNRIVWVLLSHNNAHIKCKEPWSIKCVICKLYKDVISLSIFWVYNLAFCRHTHIHIQNSLCTVAYVHHHCRWLGIIFEIFYTNSIK